MAERACCRDVDDRRGVDVVLGGKGLGGQDRAQEVGGQLALELVLGDAGQRRERDDGRVVHEHVDRAEHLARPLEEAADVPAAGHVALDGDRPAALGGDVRDHPPGALRIRAVVHHDGCAALGQGFGDPRAQALRCAGDDGRTCVVAAHSDSLNVGAGVSHRRRSAYW